MKGVFNMDEANSESTIKILQNKIDQLEAELNNIKSELSPDKISKKIDSSYLSVNNMRLWLQILALIQTIFVAGAIAFGFIGMTNINQIRAEADKVKEMSKTIEESGSKIIDKVKKYDAQLNQLEKLSNSFAEKDRVANEKVESIERRTTSTLNQSEQRLNERLLDAENKIAAANTKLKDISSMFNQVSIQYDNILNPREQLLLALLARKIEPDNISYSYNSAIYSYAIGRYDEAITEFEKATRSKDLPSNVIEKAKQGIINAKWMKENYKRTAVTNPELIRLGDYSALQLLINTIETLSVNGYLTRGQAEKLFADAKIKSQ
jgi:tetratricopeptide (TPR) repeat protein